MGRWYYGDIHGKCWFGVQDSNDASNFGVEPTEEYRFIGCGCLYEPNNPYKTDNNAYCTDCFPSYEDHFEDIKAYVSSDSKKTWNSGSCIYYYFTEGDLDKVQEVVKELDAEVGHYLKNFTLDTDNADGITYNCDFSDKRIGKKKQKKMARLCLGLQIIKSIETNGSCSFNVET